MDLVSTKYTYACDPDYCDCLIELTTSDKFGFPATVNNITCPCGRVLEPLSVVTDTILPITEQKENSMDTIAEVYNPDLLVTYKRVTNGEVEFATDKVNHIEWELSQSRRNAERNAKMNDKVFTLENMLHTYCQEASSPDMAFITEIAELFDISLTKDIEVTGTISFSATVRVSLTDEYDIESMINDELSVSSYGGDVDVNDYSIEDVREY